MPDTESIRKPETLGRRLRASRALCGLTQLEVAEKLGVSQATISYLETDQSDSPPINTIVRLAELYGVSIEYLAKGAAA